MYNNQLNSINICFIVSNGIGFISISSCFMQQPDKSEVLWYDHAILEE